MMGTTPVRLTLSTEKSELDFAIRFDAEKFLLENDG